MERAAMMELNLSKDWAEILFFIVMVLGAIIGLAAPSAFISYIIIAICGLYAGRVIFKTKNIILFPFILASLGFLIGFILVLYYGNRLAATIIFLIGIIAGYKVYQKKLLRD